MLWYLPAAAVLLLAGFTLYAYCTAFYQSPQQRKKQEAVPDPAQYRNHTDQTQALIQEISALPAEEITISAWDGKTLFARYYHLRDNAPLQIQCHGYRGTALRDFCGGSKLARDLGHNILLIDQRAHGKSEGRSITFGIRECRDILDWITYVNRRFGPDTKLLLAGVSMGAATVLMAAGLDLPENVRGIIADSAYSSPEAIIRRVCKFRKLPPALAFPFVRLGGKLFGHFDILEYSALEAMERAYVPVLLIHGEEDHFVPCEMSRELAAACVSPVTLELFPDAGHGFSYLVDPVRYRLVVESFLRRCNVEYQEAP